MKLFNGTKKIGLAFESDRCKMDSIHLWIVIVFSFSFGDADGTYARVIESKKLCSRTLGPSFPGGALGIVGGHYLF